MNRVESISCEIVRGPLALVVCALALLAGCDKAPPAAQPAPQPVKPAPAATRPAAKEAPAEKSPLLAEAEKWSLAEALSQLAKAAPRAGESPRPVKLDDWKSISAAVRIVRLAKLKSPLVAEKMPAAVARRLRVARVAQSRWALGLVEKPERVLSSPVFIDAEGGVTSAVEGDDEAAARLYVSKDAEVFPHILVLPQRVLIVGDETSVALAGKKLHEAVFELRFRKDYPYVALVCRGALPLFEDPPDKDRAEAALYRWDPDEPGFLGPAMDDLPDPCGGKFELDLAESKSLIPVGGEIAEPKQPEPPPKPKKVEEEPPPQ